MRIQEELVRNEPANSMARFNLGISNSYLGRAHTANKDSKSAIRVFDEGIKHIEILLNDHPKNIGYRQEKLIMLNSVGQLKTDTGDYVGAETAYRTVIDGYSRILRETPGEPRSELNLFLTKAELGFVLLKNGRNADALKLLREALKKGRKLDETNALMRQHKEQLERVSDLLR